MIDDRPPRARWPRNQRFTLSPTGIAAELAYRTEIVASRAREGRASYDSARAAWATAHGIEPDDGLYLGELTGKPKNVQEVATAVESCGKSRHDALSAMERMFDARLIVADVPALTPKRW